MKGVEKTIIKRMTRLGEGLRIESLILSRERFSDVGFATRFVLDQGLDIKSSQVLLDQGVFTFQVMSREAFEESTLQRIRITEGVEAVIGFLAVKEEMDQKNNNCGFVYYETNGGDNWKTFKDLYGSEILYSVDLRSGCRAYYSPIFRSKIKAN